MREIDWDKPLSDEEKGWLRQRDRHAEVEANERRFAKKAKAAATTEVKEPDDDETEGTEEVPVIGEETFDDDYDSWKVAELKAEAEGRDPEIDTSTLKVKADYVAALRTWDKANPDE